MTIVATSIPVLRVVFKQALNSAIAGYAGRSKASRSRTTPSNTGTLQDRVSNLQFGKKTPEISTSGDSVKDMLARGSQHDLEMDDMVVDKQTRRVTSPSPDGRPDSSEHQVPSWSV